MNWLLRISILLNVVLVGMAGLVFCKPAASPTSPAQSVSLNESEAAAPEEPAPESPAAGAGIFTTNTFHWRVLEATNYAAFVANLRGVGCPDRTIRDILFADAERRYAAAEAASPEDHPFWLAGRALAAANRRAQTNRSAAQAAVVADLKQVFGVDWTPEDGEMRKVKIQAVSRLVVGPVSDEEHERVWRWLLTTMQQRQSFRSDRQYLLLASDHAEWEDIATGRRLQLEQILNPAAFEELQARTALLEEIFDAKYLHVEDLELTPEELRRVCLAKVRLVGWLEEVFESRRRQSDEAVEDKRVAFTAALKQELSPDHFEEFVRVQDDDYREILEATRAHNLPRSAAHKVYEVRRLVQAEYRRLKAEADQAETAATVAALQATAEDSIRKIMGAEAFQKFAARNGQWVTNFSKL